MIDRIPPGLATLLQSPALQTARRLENLISPVVASVLPVMHTVEVIDRLNPRVIDLEPVSDVPVRLSDLQEDWLPYTLGLKWFKIGDPEAAHDIIAQMLNPKKLLWIGTKRRAALRVLAMNDFGKADWRLKYREVVEMAVLEMLKDPVVFSGTFDDPEIIKKVIRREAERRGGRRIYQIKGKSCSYKTFWKYHLAETELFRHSLDVSENPYKGDPEPDGHNHGTRSYRMGNGSYSKKTSWNRQSVEVPVKMTFADVLELTGWTADEVIDRFMEKGDETRREIVRLSLMGERPRDLEKTFGIPSNLIRQWVYRFKKSIR